MGTRSWPTAKRHSDGAQPHPCGRPHPGSLGV